MYLIKDTDNDGDWSDATSNDIIVINTNTTGLTLTDGDNFGASVAFNPDATVLAVGATGDNTCPNASDDGCGTVYLIDDGGNGWADIAAADITEINHNTAGITLASYDYFGISVAFSDGLLAVGANLDDTGGSNRGAVYLVDDGDDDWGSVLAGDVTKISHSSDLGISLDDNDNFGSGVALSADGTIIAVGARFDDDGGSNRGAVYILSDTNNDNDYADTGENTKISDSTNGITLVNNSNFGTAVSLESGMLAVGAPNPTGAVYLIEDGDDGWGSVAAADITKIGTNTNDFPLIVGGDRFGSGVALHGGTLAAGAERDDTCPGATDTSCGAVYTFETAYTTTIPTGDFEKDSTPTSGDSKLADGATVTVTATATDTAGNTGTDTTTFLYDQSVPTVTGGGYVGTTVTLTLSEAVYGTAEANDFTIVNDSGGTPANITPTGITLAGSASGASATVTLTVPSTTWAGTVKAYYTHDTDATKRVRDEAGNALAAIASGSAVSLTAGTISAAFSPSDGGYLTSLSGNVVISFGSAAFSDNACATALTSATANAATDLKEDDASGNAITHTVTYDATARTITLDPSSDLTEGDVVYAAISNLWYYSVNGCAQGAAANATFTVDATAPTVVSGSTGYYSDSALTTALSGSVGAGNDVYTKYTFSEAMGETVSDTATARPELFSVISTGSVVHSYAGSSSDITLDAANTNATGVVATSTGIYVVDNGTTDKIYAYNLDGTRNATADVTLGSDASFPYALAATDTHFLVYTGGGGIRAYTLAGTRDSTKDISDPAGNEGSGLVADSSGIYLTDNSGGSSKVYAYTTAGGRNSGADFSFFGVGYANASGITRTADGFYIADIGNSKVLAFSTSGTYDSTRSFSFTSENANPSGITALANGDLLVADSADNKLYRYNSPTPATQYDIIASGTPEDGDCVESGTGNDDDKQYTCRYTVKSADTGTFKARVGTNTADKAGNNLASAYTHASGLSIDSTAPAATYTTSTSGGVTDGSDTLLNTGDTVSVQIGFNKPMGATAPSVQFMNSGTDLGSAVSGARDGTLAVALSDTAGDSASTTDPIDFGTPSSVLTREAVGSGYVYKVSAAQSGLYLGVSGDMTTGAALKGRWHTSKPTSAEINSVGTEFLSVGSGGDSATVYGGKRFATVSAGTYFWFYPSDTNAGRTVTNREMTVLTGVSAGRVLDFASGTLAAADSAGTDDPIDFGSPTGGSGIVRETLGNGYVYKTTRAFRRLSIGTNGTYAVGGTHTHNARRASSKPATTTVTTHGSELWSETIPYNAAVDSGANILADVPSGTYFWFYPSATMNVTNRAMNLRGTDAVVSNPVFTAVKTIAAGESAASGSLQYDVVNEASVADTAGNPMAAKAATTIANVAVDTTAPTVSGADYSGSTVTITLSEGIYAATAPGTADFAITRSGGGAPTVSSISGLPSAVGSADNSFTLTLSATAKDHDSLAYTQSGTDAKIPRDAAGNKLAGFTRALGVSVNAPSDLSLAADDDTGVSDSDGVTKTASGLTISGCAKAYSTVSLLNNGTAFSPAETDRADGSTCTNGGDTGGKAWSVDIALTEGTHTLTATATSGITTSAPSAPLVLTVDTTAPAGVVESVSGGFVGAAEDDGSVTVRVSADEPLSSATFSITDGTDTVTPTGRRSAGFADKLDNRMGVFSLEASDYFGWATAIDGDVLAIGADGDTEGGINAGTVYLITDSDGDGEWSDATSDDVIKIDGTTDALTLSNYDQFGWSVDLDDGVLAVGDIANDTGGYGRGAVYLIADGGDGWATIESTDVVKLSSDTAGITLEDYDQFGYSVAIDNGLLAVGVPNDDTGGNGRGAVYLIDDGGDGWGSVESTDVTKITENTDGISLSDNDKFGQSIGLDGDVLAVGASGDDTGGAGRGAVYILDDKNNDGDYADTGENIKIDNSTAGITLANSDFFGSAVSIDDGLLAGGTRLSNGSVGAFWLIDDGGDGWGSIVADDVERLSGGLRGITLETGDSFGQGIGITNGMLAVGAIGDDDGGTQHGAVYVLRPAVRATLTTDNFEKDTTPTDDDALAVGTITVTATPTDVAGNAGSAVTGSFVYDLTPPTVTAGDYYDRDITLTTGEPVWGTAEADDFVISNNSAVVRPTAITLAGSADTADTSIVLTVPSVTWGSPVTIIYTQDTDAGKRVYDRAGNPMATFDGLNALTLTPPPPPTSPSALDLAADDDTGISNSDNVTRTTTGLSISGCAKADTTVTLLKDGAAFSPAVTTTASGATCTNGTDTEGKEWTADIALTARAAPYSITATITASRLNERAERGTRPAGGHDRPDGDR